jgi:signal transduction histidine kinase
MPRRPRTRGGSSCRGQGDGTARGREALLSLQTDLTTALRQKERLAQLGGAVAKVSHDLRNILTSAQLFADRIEGAPTPP